LSDEGTLGHPLANVDGGLLPGGRQRFDIILMVGNQPAGRDNWNFDREASKPPKGKLSTHQKLFGLNPTITSPVNLVKQSEALKTSKDTGRNRAVSLRK